MPKKATASETPIAAFCPVVRPCGCEVGGLLLPVGVEVGVAVESVVIDVVIVAPWSYHWVSLCKNGVWIL
jgi:hypothetical protein